MYKNIFEHLNAKKILILGFGSEGKSSYRFIKNNIEKINPVELAVADTNGISENLDFGSYKVRKISGPNYLDAMSDFDLILKSPGIHFNIYNKKIVDDHWELEEFPGVEITCQMDLFLRYSQSQIIGVSGSKGKSTTTSLVYQVLKNVFSDSYLLGNIGVPVLDYFTELNEDSYCAVEMGVHQLEFCMRSPHVAILTNIHEEHLDHYKDYADYKYSKFNLIRWQSSDDFLIVPEDEIELLEAIQDIYKSKLIFVKDMLKTNLNSVAEKLSSDLIKRYSLEENKKFIFFDLQKNEQEEYKLLENHHILGRHNEINTLLALAASEIFTGELEKGIVSVKEFNGLEHRLEYVGEVKEIKFFNDSIATIPEACKLAIEALQPIAKVSTLLMGGLDRNIDYTELVEFLFEKQISNIICFPDTGKYIADIVNELNSEMEFKINAVLVNTMKEAVDLAFEITKAGEICLLSPAAASYNQYKNFAERGKAFKDEIKSHKWLVNW